jgi:ribosomal protein L32
VELDECWICGRRIDGELAAIGRSGDRLSYVPFVQDLRTGALALAHPVCFATEHGVEALVLLVYERDYEVAETLRPR